MKNSQSEKAAQLSALHKSYAAGLPRELSSIELTWREIETGAVGTAGLEQLLGKVHSLAGSGGTFGFNVLSETALALMVVLKEAKQGGWSLTDEHHGQIRQLVADLRAVLSGKSISQPMFSIRSLASATDGKRLVFVVEDDPDLTDKLAVQLARFGYEVKQFSTATDLLRTLIEVIPAAIVIDLMLPEGRFAGAEAIKEFRRVHGSDVPIIFISVRSDVLARLQAVRAGATHYFVKPLSVHRLVKTLNEVTEKRSIEPYRVLIVDDDAHLTAMYSFIFEQAGLSTRVVNDSMKVLAEVESFRPELILMDVYMPESTGTEMAAVIRQHSEYTGIPIVYLSIENNFDKQLAALNLGGDDFLTKPITPQQLIRGVLPRTKRFRAMNNMNRELREAVQELENQRAALDLHSIVCIFGVDGRIIHINDKFTDISAFHKDDVLGRDFSMFILSLHERSVLKTIKTTIQSGNVWHGEIQQRTKHARFFWSNTSIVPFLDASGKPYQFVAISTDITQHKEAEAALHKAHEELESRVRARTQALRAANRQLEQHIQERERIQDDLFEAKERAEVTLHSMGEGVITTDAGGTIEYLNPVAEALTGWPMSEAKGQRLENVLQLLREDNREAIPHPVSSCLARGAGTEVLNDALLLSRDGKSYTVQNSVSAIRNHKGEILGVVLVLNDITESRRLVEQISYQATHDSLTGLVNRREFECRIEHALAGYREHGSHHSLCYLDLDQFKLVNDTAGHAIGDRLLQQIANLLLSLIRERDTLARLGGDEFGLLLNNCRVKDSYTICEAIVSSVRDFKFTWGNRTFQIGVSIGVAPITADTETPAQLLSQADVACYTAKDQGRNQVYAYRSENGEPTRQHGEILRAAELKNAIIENRFRIYLQPLRQLKGLEKTTPHYEVLLRLINQYGDVVLPSAFISAAERFGLIGEIDRWVLHTAFALCRDLLEKCSQVQLAINLSGHSLSDNKLFDYICRQYRDFAIPADAICFEITETAAVQSLNKASDFIKELKTLGFRFALDDFGTGLSSFRYLKKLPVDYLKIDGSFVKGMVTDSTDHSMVEAIHQIGCSMGLKTIAEYAETAAIVEQLRKLGVDFAQGFALGYPVPAEEML